MSNSAVSAIPVLPAADVSVSLAWWTGVCGFTEAFRHGTPVSYAGITLGGARLHLSLMQDTHLARIVGDQTMVRIMVDDVAAFYAAYVERFGTVHPNGGLEEKPWGSREFGAIDPNGVCVAFVQA